MQQGDPILKDEDRAKLDAIVMEMANNNAPETDVQAVVADFKSKYGVEKKSPDQTISEDSGTGSEVFRGGGDVDPDLGIEQPKVGQDIAFGGAALTREEAERQSDIKIPKERAEKYLKILENAPNHPGP